MICVLRIFNFTFINKSVFHPIYVKYINNITSIFHVHIC